MSNLTVKQATVEVQRVWRGYLGRKEGARVQLQRERGKIRNKQQEKQRKLLHQQEQERKQKHTPHPPLHRRRHEEDEPPAVIVQKAVRRRSSVSLKYERRTSVEEVLHNSIDSLNAAQRTPNPYSSSEIDEFVAVEQAVKESPKEDSLNREAQSEEDEMSADSTDVPLQRGQAVLLSEQSARMMEHPHLRPGALHAIDEGDEMMKDSLTQSTIASKLSHVKTSELSPRKDGNYRNARGAHTAFDPNDRHVDDHYEEEEDDDLRDSLEGNLPGQIVPQFRIKTENAASHLSAVEDDADADSLNSPDDLSHRKHHEDNMPNPSSLRSGPPSNASALRNVAAGSKIPRIVSKGAASRPTHDSTGYSLAPSPAFSTSATAEKQVSQAHQEKGLPSVHDLIGATITSQPKSEQGPVKTQQTNKLVAAQRMYEQSVARNFPGRRQQDIQNRDDINRSEPTQQFQQQLRQNNVVLSPMRLQMSKQLQEHSHENNSQSSPQHLSGRDRAAAPDSRSHVITDGLPLPLSSRSDVESGIISARLRDDRNVRAMQMHHEDERQNNHHPQYHQLDEERINSGRRNIPPLEILNPKIFLQQPQSEQQSCGQPQSSRSTHSRGQVPLSSRAGRNDNYGPLPPSSGRYREKHPDECSHDDAIGTPYSQNYQQQQLPAQRQRQPRRNQQQQPSDGGGYLNKFYPQSRDPPPLPIKQLHSPNRGVSSVSSNSAVSNHNKILSPLKKVVQQMSPNRDAMKQRQLRGGGGGVEGSNTLRASEIEEQKLLAEIDNLNAIQRKKMGELRHIEQLERQRIHAGISQGAGNAVNAMNPEKQQKHQQKRKDKSEEQLAKEKEKKAFGWGARDFKSNKGDFDSAAQKKVSSPKRKKKMKQAEAQQQVNEWRDMQQMSHNHANPSSIPQQQHQSSVVSDAGVPHYPVAGGLAAGYGAGVGYMNLYAKHNQKGSNAPGNRKNRQPVTADVSDGYSHSSAYDLHQNGHSPQREHPHSNRKAARLRVGVEETVSLPEIPAAGGVPSNYQHPLRNSRRVDSREKNSSSSAPAQLREENQRLKQQLEEMKMMQAAQRRHR